MQFLSTLLFILLFILCLSVLVIIHEFGHFSAAKFFKVYVQEFSIGFGPALIHKKRKNGETYFSLRAIPFGGYVSMYGEEAGTSEREDIDPNRAYNRLKKWKKLIILFAGVFNNAVFAVLLFFISESCFPSQNLYLSYLEVKEGSIAYSEPVNLKTDDYVSIRPSYFIKDGKKTKSTSYYTIDLGATLTYLDETSNPQTKTVAATMYIGGASYNSRNYDTMLHYFDVDGDVVDFSKEYLPTNVNVKSVAFSVTRGTTVYKQYHDNVWYILPKEKPVTPFVGQAFLEPIITETGTKYKLLKWDGNEWVSAGVGQYSYTVPENPNDCFIWGDIEGNLDRRPTMTLNVVTNEQGNRVFESTGLSLLYEQRWKDNFGQILGKTFYDWGYSAGAIVRGFASLFTSTENWKDIGGIVAIGVQTTNILQNFGLGRFIYVWGLISVNLAIVNLFPFPGLDGWQILVIIVEGIFHKEIPAKVKTIISFIGLIVLFAFMAIILIKDVIGLF